MVLSELSVPKRHAHYPSARQGVPGFLIWLALIGCLGQPSYAATGCTAANFQVAPSISLEFYIDNVAKADFNSDGHLDLATTDRHTNEALVFFGRGGMQGFGPPNSFATGLEPKTVVGADFNGDGKLDLLTSNGGGFGSTPGSISILLGDGSGNFSAPINISLP